METTVLCTQLWVPLTRTAATPTPCRVDGVLPPRGVLSVRNNASPRPARISKRVLMGASSAVMLGGLSLIAASGASQAQSLSDAATATAASCVSKPNGSNTGSSSSLPRASVTEAKTNGQVLQNATIAGGLTVTGSNVTVRNVRVVGSVLVTGANVTLDHVSSTGIGISGASGTKVRYNNIANSPEDGLHVTSDRGRVSNVTLEYNFVHAPKVPADAHYDGLQVRGVDGLMVRCNTINLGTYKSTYNAAVYLEDANGGDKNVTISNNWLNGGGFTIMVDATNLTVTDNVFGTRAHWGQCDNRANSGGTASFTSRGNTLPSGGKLSPCGQG